MARILYSGIISELRGSVGHATFQRCGSIKSIRNKPISYRQASVNQQSLRSVFSNYCVLFKSLSTANLAKYQLFIDFFYNQSSGANRVKLSIYNVFMQYHLLAYPQLSDALYNPALSDLYSYEWIPQIILDAGVLSLVLSDDITWGVYGFNLRMSSPQTSIINPDKRNIKPIYLDMDDGNIFDITDSYENALGSLPSIGEYIAIDCIVYSAVSPIAKRLQRVFIKVSAP